MDLLDVRRLAVQLMITHGVGDWRLVFDRAKTRAGQCRYSRREISLSAPLMLLQNEETVRETVLHEIAHALAGPRAGHGPAWQAVARRIGSTAARTLVSPDLPARDWIGTCPAGHVAERHRRPQAPLSCTRCSRSFSLDALLTWEYKGRPAPMTPAYRAKEAAMRARVTARGERGA